MPPNITGYIQHTVNKQAGWKQADNNQADNKQADNKQEDKQEDNKKVGCKHLMAVEMWCVMDGQKTEWGTPSRKSWNPFAD